MTRAEKADRYEEMASGNEMVESCLHLNLIEHLNAEISLGTVHDIVTAARWLRGTFLYVRMTKNPLFYKLQGDAAGADVDERVQDICARDIGLLQATELVSRGSELKCTEYGEAMGRYYVKFGTMQAVVRLKQKAKVSEIVGDVFRPMSGY